MKSLFASKAEMETLYLSKNGCPIKTLSRDAKGRLKVLSMLTGNQLVLDGGELLRPYDKNLINKEANQMAKAMKDAKVKNGNSDVREGHTSIEKMEGGKWVLTKNLDGKDYRVTINGGLTYEGKKYPSLREIVSAITKTAYPYGGFGFFALKNKENKAAAEAARKVIRENKAKGRKARQADTREDDNTPEKSKAAASGKHQEAAIQAKGRN